MNRIGSLRKSNRSSAPARGILAAFCLAPALIVPLLAQHAPAKKKAAASGKQHTAAGKAAAPATGHSPLATAPPTGPLKSYVETLPSSGVKVTMMPIPGGSLTVHGQKVEIKPFWIASTETTWEAFDTFVQSGEASPAYDQTKYTPDAVARPSKSYILPDLGWGHNGFPAINLSTDNVTMYCRWMAKATGKKYRLPTEAEWEWACRAGNMGTVKMTPAQAEKVAWYKDDTKTTKAVGKKAPNGWKLFDMYGNAGEWATTADGKFLLCGGTFKDPVTALTPTERKKYTVKWQETDPQLPKSRWWLSDAPFCGFRVVCEGP